MGADVSSVNCDKVKLLEKVIYLRKEFKKEKGLKFMQFDNWMHSETKRNGMINLMEIELDAL